MECKFVINLCLMSLWHNIPDVDQYTILIIFFAQGWCKLVNVVAAETYIINFMHDLHLICA